MVTARRNDADDAVYQEIRRVLEQSATNWSAGNLEGFMECYEDSPDTVYLSAAQVVYGYRSIHDMYAQRLGMTGEGRASPAQPIQPLTMTLLQITRMGPEHALAIGRYALASADSVAPRAGIWSLVLHNTACGWRICADHTS